MRNIKIELKIILSVVFFTLFIVSLERYMLSKNIVTQFEASKESKNMLLINTISPVISLNISLGLYESNMEYLDLIVAQNRDITYLELFDDQNHTLYSYKKEKIAAVKIDGLNGCENVIIDNITNNQIGRIVVGFDNSEYKNMRKLNNQTTIKIFVIAFLMLGVFLLLIRKEFRHLRELSNKVLEYDPKINNFEMKESKKLDEVGVIHNAIVAMVAKIHSYTKIMDELNFSLEDKVKKRTKELQEANEKLEKLSKLDPLTQIANRRYFDTYLKEVWELSVRAKTSVSIVMCDIDYFKNINDTYGHQVGDEVLKNTACVIQRSLKRSTDMVARYGGEEFIIVLYDSDINGALELCKEIARNLSDIKNFTVGEQVIKPFTLSFGVCSMVARHKDEYGMLIRKADNALYEAKEQGRDRIVTCKSSTI